MTPLLISIVTTAGAAACGPLDLETALALAGQRSDEVAIVESERAAAEADRSIARAARAFPVSSATLVLGPAPEARGSVVSSDDTNRSLRGLAPFGRVDVDLVQPIFTWGQLDAASDAANAGIRARGLLIQSTLSQIELRVVRLYWGEVLARRLLSIAADVESALARVDKRVSESLASKDGEVSANDRYRIEYFRGKLRERKADAQRGLELAHIGLAATLAIPSKSLSLVQVELPAVAPQAIDEEAAQMEAERRRPDLLALDEAISARRAEVQASEAARLPQLFAAGQFSYAYAPNRDAQLNPWVDDPFNHLRFGAVLGIRQNLSFPLLSARVEKARSELRTLEQRRAGLLRLVSVEVASAAADLRAAQERLAAAQGALASARTWFRATGMSFGMGTTEARELLEAYTSYIDSQVVMAQSSYDLLVLRARMDQVTGAAPKRGEPKCTLH